MDMKIGTHMVVVELDWDQLDTWIAEVVEDKTGIEADVDIEGLGMGDSSLEINLGKEVEELEDLEELLGGKQNEYETYVKAYLGLGADEEVKVYLIDIGSWTGSKYIVILTHNQYEHCKNKLEGVTSSFKSFKKQFTSDSK